MNSRTRSKLCGNKDVNDDEKLKPLPRFQPNETNHTKSKSIKEAHFEKLKEVVERQKAIGHTLICGLPVTENVVGRDITEEEEKTLRHVIITGNRDKALRSAVKMVLMGSTSDIVESDQLKADLIVCFIPKEVKKILRRKRLSDRLDHLYALTYALKIHPAWLKDNTLKGTSEGFNFALRALGEAWSCLLKTHSVHELGIDDGYTRPGIEAFLDQFSSLVYEYAADSVPFQWR